MSSFSLNDHMYSLCLHVFLDQISFMADKILSLSIEYVSFSSSISDAMTSFFSWAITASLFILITDIELIRGP